VEEQNTEENIYGFDEQDNPIYLKYKGIEIVRLDL
jgi:hypothetical protein